MVVLALVSCVGSQQTTIASHTPLSSDGSVNTAKVKRIRTELHFGLGKPVGQVSADEWRSFLDDFVTPRFPRGLTICDSYGQWGRDGVQVKKETSKLLIIVHDGDATQDTAIEEIRAEYKKRFQQESVLRVDGPVKASF